MTNEALSRRRGTSTLGLLTVTAIAAVLVIISLPRLHGFALHENEGDAAIAVRLLSRALEKHAPSGELALQEFIEDAGLARQLSDADYLSDGRLLRRHGYLFAVQRRSSPTSFFPPAPGEVFAADGLDSELIVVAWPWSAPRTGRGSFAAPAGGEVWQHANGDAAWSGASRPPALASAAGWTRR